MSEFNIFLSYYFIHKLHISFIFENIFIDTCMYVKRGTQECDKNVTRRLER